MTSQLKVIIVEDEISQADALALALGRIGIATHLCASSGDLLGSDELASAGCIVIDVQLAGESGLELQAELLNRGSETPVVFVSGRASVSDTIQAYENGAYAFIEKPYNVVRLSKTVAQVLHLEVMRRSERQKREQRLSPLSPREREVLEELVTGNTVKLIGRKLEISTSTAEKHRASVLAKLKFENVIELTRYILEEPHPPTGLHDFRRRLFAQESASARPF